MLCSQVYCGRWALSVAVRERECGGLPPANGPGRWPHVAERRARDAGPSARPSFTKARDSIHLQARGLALAGLTSLLTVVGCVFGSGTGAVASVPPSPLPALRLSGSGSALPAVQKLAEAYAREHPEARFHVEGGTNTGGAIRGVLDGTLDIAIGNRLLSAAEAGEPVTYRAFARDAVVFAVHMPNPVSALSSTQVREIYGGALSDWGQLGASPAAIIVLDRDEDESMRRLVLLPLMADRPVEARTTTLSSASDMAFALDRTPNAIGYSSLGLLRILEPRFISVVALDGTVPDRERVVTGLYPWYLTLALIHRDDAPERVLRFVDFALDAEGAQVLAVYGYAPPQR